jgi:hypothetical protein
VAKLLPMSRIVPGIPREVSQHRRSHRGTTAVADSDGHGLCLTRRWSTAENPEVSGRHPVATRLYVVPLRLTSVACLRAFCQFLASDT